MVNEKIIDDNFDKKRSDLAYYKIYQVNFFNDLYFASFQKVKIIFSLFAYQKVQKKL